MSRKRKNNQFFVGKGIPPTDKGRKPMVGSPNSNLDTYNKKDGTFRSRRRYGADGRAVKDLDTPHFKIPFDHVHDVGASFHCGEHRKPTKKELCEIKKAKRKRRFWK